MIHCPRSVPAQRRSDARSRISSRELVHAHVRTGRCYSEPLERVESIDADTPKVAKITRRYTTRGEFAAVGALCARRAEQRARLIGDERRRGGVDKFRVQMVPRRAARVRGKYFIIRNARDGIAVRRRALDAGDEVSVAWKLISERLQPRESKALIAILVYVKFTNAARSAREKRRVAITFRVVLVEHTRTSPNNSVRCTSYFINRRVETLNDVVV